jgi:hypothetical protein
LGLHCPTSPDAGYRRQANGPSVGGLGRGARTPHRREIEQAPEPGYTEVSGGG